MTIYEDLAAIIIDKVSDSIQEAYDLNPYSWDGDDNLDSPAIVNGTLYYELESSIGELIKELVDKEIGIRYNALLERVNKALNGIANRQKKVEKLLDK